jgi:hypothetical protein
MSKVLIILPDTNRFFISGGSDASTAFVTGNTCCADAGAFVLTSEEPTLIIVVTTDE